jgi:hypothetical protein
MCALLMSDNEKRGICLVSVGVLCTLNRLSCKHFDDVAVY